MMRTALLFLIIGSTVCTFCKAQDIPVLSQEEFRHHEFSVSYGFLPITDANSMAEECFAPVASFYEAATASVSTLMRTPSTPLSASAQAVAVAPVVNTSSIISTCFPAKASARRRQKMPSTFSHRS